MIKAALLDRDGTINVEKGYVYRVEDFEFLPGAIEGMKMLVDGGFKLFVVTNQSGIALKKYTLENMVAVHDHMLKELSKENIPIEKIYYCPHHSSVKPCYCRKPAPGLLMQARWEYKINVSKSFMVGNRESDVWAGCVIGLNTVLIGHGPTVADYQCDSLLEAAKIIVGVKPCLKG